MRVGTIVRLSDGREGTVVYHGLDGHGIKWGRHQVTESDLILAAPPPDDWPWFPEAMLRSPYPSADVECVGSDFEAVEVDDG